jgi:hypothetical protein
MAEDLPLVAIPPTLPEGYCPGSLQEFVNDVWSETTFQGGVSLDNIEISETAPTDHTKVWFKVDGSLNPFAVPGGVPLFKWSNTLAAWVLRHPELPSSDKIILYKGANDAANLWALDGGDGTDPSVPANVSDTTGSFWEVDTDMAGRFPVGPGTINASGTVVAVGDTGGNDQVTQTSVQLVPHTHSIGVEVSTDTAGSENGRLRAGGTNIEWQGTTATTQIGNTRSTGGSGSPATAQPMTTTPPYRGRFFIKRTARTYLLG